MRVGVKERCLRPGEDRDQDDANHESVLDTKRHQEGRNDATAEDAHPQLFKVSHTFPTRSTRLSDTLGFDIWPPSHMPVCSLIMPGGQPPRARGVEVQPPVMAPIPAEYERPISVRKKPMPTPVAVLMVAGMSLTSHWRMPVRARTMNIKPSMKTAVRAVLYETLPLPLYPTTWGLC